MDKHREKSQYELLLEQIKNEYPIPIFEQGSVFYNLEKTAQDEFIKLRARLEQAEAVIETAETLTKNLPYQEIELARDAWGNTNTNLIADCIHQLKVKIISTKAAKQ